MKKLLSTLAVCACFLLMLTATSKKRPPREAGSIPKLTIPATTGWARNEVAGIRFLSPPNSVVERAETLDGIRIKLASGSEIKFESQVFDVANTQKHEHHMYFAPDANIWLHDTSIGDECQATACTTMPIMGKPLCMAAFPKTFDECTQVVALVRSIQPL